MFLTPLFVALLAAPVWSDSHRFIQVQGMGQVEVVPDMATVNFAINHQERTAQQAFGKVADSSNRVIAELKAAGIPEKDIQTNGLSLNQVFDHRNSNNEPPKLVGFFASNRLSVRVRDIGGVGPIIDRIIAAGVNSFQGIAFEVSDPTAAQNASRRAAVDDAMAKARLYADSAEVTLGDVMEISEVGANQPSGPIMRVESMRADSMPIAPGTQSINVNILLKVSLR